MRRRVDSTLLFEKRAIELKYESLAFLFAICLVMAVQTLHGGSATWNGSLNFGDFWEYSENWTPNTVPKLPGDSATFDVSDQTFVNIAGHTVFDIDSIVFNPAASAFTIAMSSARESSMLTTCGSSLHG